MNYSLLNFLTPINLVLCVFCIIILVSFMILVFKGDDNERSMQKIIGGLSIFCVSLISGINYITLVSLFIGGLIIASEKFMKDLAGILRADSKDIIDILNYAPASQEDINRKVKEELENETANSNQRVSNDNSRTNRFESIQNSIKERKNIEDKTLEFIPSVLENGWKLFTGIKIYGANDNYFVADGLLKNEIYKKTNILEVVYIKDISSIFSLKRSVERFVGNIFSKLRNVDISIVFVSDDISLEDILKTKNYLKSNYPEINFGVFSWNTNLKIIEKKDVKENLIA